MAEFEPNKQQQEFLRASNCNLLVSASAGSGKTSTMIQKLIKILIEDKCPITTLLVVTYTNAAASEIKLRLFNEITKLISSTEDINKKTFLKTQLDNINNAEIGTLHSICKKLITKYFYTIDETPDFALISDKEQKYLLDIVVNNVLSRHMSSEDEDFFELYDSYNTNRSDMQLKKMLLQMYNYKLSKIGYNDWKNTFLNNSYNLNLNENIVCNYLLDYYQKLILSFSSKIISIKNLSESKDFSRYSNYINVRYQFINEFSIAKDFETSVKILNNYIFPAKPRITEKNSIDEQQFDEMVSAFNSQFSYVIKKLKEDYCSEDLVRISSGVSNSKKNVVKLLEIVDEIEESYSVLKNKRNVLDFNDLEDKMLKLLEDEKLKNTLMSQYKYIFVDEYQDINDKQELILSNLVSDNNYYMIGDVKQSIYAFRQSSPKIFIDKYNDFSKESNTNQVIKFNINYRSDRNILEYANSVFDNIITRNTIGIDYASDSRFESDKEYKGSNVTLNIIDSNDEDIEDKEEIEAKLIVDEISRYLNTQKTDGSNYTYSDIAIILRQRGTFVKKLCDILAKHNVPVKTTISSDFFATSEVALMLAILKVISNYKDDVSLSVVLKNLFKISEDELMRIRACNKDDYFYNCIVNYPHEDDIRIKINNCLKFVEESKRMLVYTTISDYLTKVVYDYDILLNVKVSPNGVEKENNILEFIKIADNINFQYNIDKFLDYLEITSKETSLKRIGESNNAVEICTIHHSKGLEYPVVILARMGKKYQLNKDSGNIIINNKFGVGLKSVDNINRRLEETIIRSASKIDNKKSEIDEEIRLLYVAMTRAKEKLSLVGTYDLSKLLENRVKPIYSTTTSLDMVLKSITDSESMLFNNKKEFKLNEGLMSEALVKIYSQDDLIEEEEIRNNSIILNAKYPELQESLEKILNFKYNTETLTIKNTVTNILKEQNDYENLNYIPNKLDVSDKLPNSEVLELGTAYHAIMQELNFTENYIDIEEIMGRLVSDNIVAKNIMQKVKIEEIIKCISVMGALVSNSKKVYKEKQFLLCDNYNKLVKSTDNKTKVMVQGVIDLVVETEDGAILIDYKTNRGVTEKQLVDLYKLQLDLYKKAFEDATGVDITKKYLYSFSMGKLIEVE